ncbi:MAG: hypothetical protein IVW53_12495 [Chloroflexi bacterium]|nr:hypothetical protein [Chloroflexota bacterium]
MEERRPATDAALATGGWVVGETYVVRDAIERLDLRGQAGRPLQGRAVWAVEEGDGRLVWPERDWRGQWGAIRDEDRTLRPGERRVRLIVEASPDPRTRTPTVWGPGERAGLADELVALGQADEAAIVRWVEAHGFLGIRADPHEWHESVEEIRAALAVLGQARSLVAAIRTLTGDPLRAETERLLSLPPGLLTEAQADHDHQPLAGPQLARAFGIVKPTAEAWPGAGAHIQALSALSSVLQAPLERFLRVQTTIAPTGDGMRLQGAIVAAGPLATAYLRTLDEASWPAITYVGSLLRVNWQTPRPCGRCGRTFRPSRRDRKWCSERCRWAASKARAAAHPPA